LEISFAKKSLRSLCESKAKAETTFGIEAAVMLQRRLADLRAATSVKDLIAGNLNGANKKNDTEIVIDLGGRFSMILTPNHIVLPLLKSGAIDWKKVRRIKVLLIQDVHDNAR
jgi:toxin HigB-1